MAEERWSIGTVAGTGQQGCAGDGGPATEALLNNPFDLAFAGNGDLVFSDTFNHRIRRIEAGTGTISTIAGSGECGFSGDGGPATRAALNEPYGVVIDRAGVIYFADRLNGRVRAIGTDGILRTIAGDGGKAYHGDGGPGAAAGLVEPNGLALSPDQSRLFIADVADHRVRVLDLRAGTIATFAGTGAARHDGDGGPPGQAALFDAPKEMAVAAKGDIFVVDTERHAIRRIDAATWIVRTIAGDGTPGPDKLARPHGAAIGPDGKVYVGDSENHRVRVLTRVA